MKEQIKLPSYEWFLGLMAFGGAGNIYAGSYGTDPYLGCLTSDSFRYRVWIEKDEIRVNAKSLLGVLSLGITKGISVTIIAEGPDEEKAVTELVDFVSSNFS